MFRHRWSCLFIVICVVSLHSVHANIGNHPNLDKDYISDNSTNLDKSSLSEKVPYQKSEKEAQSGLDGHNVMFNEVKKREAQKTRQCYTRYSDPPENKTMETDCGFRILYSFERSTQNLTDEGHALFIYNTEKIDVEYFAKFEVSPDLDHIIKCSCKGDLCNAKGSIATCVEKAIFNNSTDITGMPNVTNRNTLVKFITNKTYAEILNDGIIFRATTTTTAPTTLPRSATVTLTEALESSSSNIELIVGICTFAILVLTGVVATFIWYFCFHSKKKPPPPVADHRKTKKKRSKSKRLSAESKEATLENAMTPPSEEKQRKATTTEDTQRGSSSSQQHSTNDQSNTPTPRAKRTSALAKSPKTQLKRSNLTMKRREALREWVNKQFARSLLQNPHEIPSEHQRTVESCEKDKQLIKWTNHLYPKFNSYANNGGNPLHKISISLDERLDFVKKLKKTNPKLYVNCQYVNEQRTVIVAQGPTLKRAVDHVMLLHALRVPAVVAIGKQQEQDEYGTVVTKYAKYIPDKKNEKLCFGPYSVVHVARRKLTHGTVVTEIDVSVDGKDTFRLEHILHRDWPDHRTPKDTKQSVEICEYLRKFAARSAPIVVHCSAGLGRSSTFALLQMMVEDLYVAKSFEAMTTKLKRIRNARFDALRSSCQYSYARWAYTEYVLSTGIVDVSSEEIGQFRKIVKKQLEEQ